MSTGEHQTVVVQSFGGWLGLGLGLGLRLGLGLGLGLGFGLGLGLVFGFKPNPNPNPNPYPYPNQPRMIVLLLFDVHQSTNRGVFGKDNCPFQLVVKISSNNGGAILV